MFSQLSQLTTWVQPWISDSYPVLRLSVLWLGVAGLAVLRGGGGGVTGDGAELRDGWVEVRLEVRGQTEDKVVAVVLLRLVTACDSWLDIWQRERHISAAVRRTSKTSYNRGGAYVYHVGAVAGRFVHCWGSWGLTGQGRGGTGRIDALLFLPAVAEPDPDHLLLHIELLGYQHDLLWGRLLVLQGKGGSQKFRAFLQYGIQPAWGKTNQLLDRWCIPLLCIASQTHRFTDIQ